MRSVNSVKCGYLPPIVTRRGNVVIIMATFRGNNQICRKGLSPISHSLRSLILLTGEMFDPSELVFSSYIYVFSIFVSYNAIPMHSM